MSNSQWTYVDLARSAFHQLDHMRRQRGKLLDLAGFGPVETPYEVLDRRAGVTLRKYGDPGAPGSGPALLIVPAPIKQLYIWDLAPEVSVVRRCLEQGMQVYLAEWTPVDPATENFGLAEYGRDLLGACVAAIQADTKHNKQAKKTEGVILAGHSLGGVLASIFAGLYPQQVRALLLLEAPLHFGADADNFAPLVAATPDARPLEKAFGNVPGSFLNFVSAAAAPHAFQWERYLDWSLALARSQTLKTHLQVERWMHDEFPLPGKLFTDVVELLYRNDQLMNGTLSIGDHTIGPASINAPLLNVIDPRSSVIPPQSILPFHEAAASASKKLLQYEGDIGVAIQHVGILTGQNAHAKVWPAVMDWLAEINLLH